MVFHVGIDGLLKKFSFADITSENISKTNIPARPDFCFLLNPLRLALPFFVIFD